MLQKKERIGAYTITFPVKEGAYAETYRVKDSLGKNFLLKLINYAKLHRTQFTEDGKVLEIEIAKQLDHANTTKFHDSGELLLNGMRYVYVVFDYIAGETVAQRMIREQGCSVYFAKQIVLGTLEGLRYLHNLPVPIIHNELTVQNVMLDLSQGTSTPTPKIIDFGYARYSNQGIGSFMKEGLNPFYVAPEALNGVFSVKSDLFSVGVFLYHLLFGELPYFIDLSKYKGDYPKIIDAITEARHRQLTIPNRNLFELDEQLINTIHKALAFDVEDRFESADDFSKAIRGELKVEDITLHKKEKVGEDTAKNIERKIAKGEGFAAISGMQELKDLMQKEVIDALRNAEEYARYGLALPNGMLLYGPPGCGKTFFAKHFAEEVGFNYMEVKPSTLKSRFVNATQENIGKMFDEAKANAPTIIFIDEMNELVPNRDNGNVHEMSRSAVNEMLAQMDRTGEDGVFVIGATNYPHMIDPAIMRAGRLDKKYYVGPPDKDARESMFQMYLRKRPYDFGIDYSKLADMTNGFVSADIKLIIDDASRIALMTHSKITQKIIEDVVHSTRPSLSNVELQKYESIKAQIEGESLKKPERRKIGF